VHCKAASGEALEEVLSPAGDEVASVALLSTLAATGLGLATPPWVLSEIPSEGLPFKDDGLVTSSPAAFSVGGGAGLGLTSLMAGEGCESRGFGLALLPDGGAGLGLSMEGEGKGLVLP
jgi:hypothetical protein